MISLEEAKNYLRVDSNDDDDLITSLIESSKRICLDVLRKDHLEDEELIKTAVYYALGYFYENRENANHKDLTLTLRALLFGHRKVEF
ncbi:head-tail connector protein [Helcococcus bovis]|uniref:head-tail connector protein n=1 Tax=Helcococcus bovis TaxID=3153252 RepID=UPI0038B8C544